MLMYRFSVNFGLLGFAKNNAVKRSRRQNTRKPDRVGRKKTCRSVTDFLGNARDRDLPNGYGFGVYGDLGSGPPTTVRCCV